MPLRMPKIGQVASYRNASGKTTDIVVTARQESAPPQPASSNSGTGGTLVAATYSYRISAVVTGIETGPSVAKTETTGGTTSTVTIDWTTIAASYPYKGATAFKVYGRNGGTELLMGTVSMPTTTFTDTGAVTPSGALPAVTNTIRGKAIHLKQVLTAARATAMKQTARFYGR